MPSALKKGRGCASNGGKGAMDDGQAEYDDVEGGGRTGFQRCGGICRGRVGTD